MTFTVSLSNKTKYLITSGSYEKNFKLFNLSYEEIKIK